MIMVFDHLSDVELCALLASRKRSYVQAWSHARSVRSEQATREARRAYESLAGIFESMQSMLEVQQ